MPLYNVLFLIFSYIWKRKQYLIIYTFQKLLKGEGHGSFLADLGEGKMGKCLGRLLNDKD